MVENLALFDSNLNRSLEELRIRAFIVAYSWLKRLLVLGKEFPKPFTRMYALNMRPNELKNKYKMYIKNIAGTWGHG